MITIITPLIQNIEQDKQKTRNTDGKTNDINERIDFLIFNLSKSDFQVVFEHFSSPCIEQSA